MGALANLKLLYLDNNNIGDPGCTALAEACGKGALAKCTSIALGGNPASADARHAVQDALKRRWLDGEFLAANLNEATSLDMSGMKWGDAEMTKLAGALEYCRAKGALANLTELWLNSNEIGDDGMQAFSGACANKALVNLGTLVLDNNKIGDDGMKAFSDACAKGALEKLTYLTVGGNPASQEARQKARNAIKNRG